ncbi:hypothetical protein F4823DRAFT_575134 [Ustulina deusta]|nr:hypothetical protein F4823DRAFT_575134 [Ustulina deusta]
MVYANLCLIKGELNVDYDSEVWDDHDEDCHGMIDTVENRVEFPEGFIWDCCGKLGYRGGCKRGRHDALDGPRGKYGDKPGTYHHPVEISSGDEQGSQEGKSENGDDQNDDDE